MKLKQPLYQALFVSNAYLDYSNCGLTNKSHTLQGNVLLEKECVLSLLTYLYMFSEPQVR